MNQRLSSMEGFSARLTAVKINNEVIELVSPIVVTDLVDVDPIKGEVHTHRVTSTELLKRVPELAGMSLDENVELAYDFHYTQVAGKGLSTTSSSRPADNAITLVNLAESNQP